jgi:hypothetical protein
MVFVESVPEGAHLHQRAAPAEPFQTRKTKRYPDILLGTAFLFYP